MGRSRNSGAVVYDVQVSQEAYDALVARAQEMDASVEEVVRADLLDQRDRLVPKARRLIRHATINVTVKEDR